MFISDLVPGKFYIHPNNNKTLLMFLYTDPNNIFIHFFLPMGHKRKHFFGDMSILEMEPFHEM